MLRNLIKISFRLIKRNRAYSIINFSGLSLGLAAFILIYLYVSYELSYDKYNENFDTIYRVNKEGDSEYMGSNKFAVTQAPLADVMRQQIPEITHVTRIATQGNLLVTAGREPFFEDLYHAIDPDAFDIFTFEVLAGSTNKILDNPRSVVLTESVATKYFGSAENAVGKTIKAETFKDMGEFEVESVIKDMPSNSHFTMKIIFQFEAIVKLVQASDLTSWGNSNYYNYIRLKPDASAPAVEAKLMEATRSHFNENNTQPAFKLQPLHDLYLGQRVNFAPGLNGNLNQVFIFSCIGILVLLIACINYTNMATARASNRAKEIGLRKVTGAKRSELIVQFIGEAIFMSVLSMIVAYAAVSLILPSFNSFLDKNITLSIQSQPVLILVLAALTLLVGTVAGIYPALVLSSLKPTQTLKGTFKTGNKLYLRDALVVFQFVISGALIFSTLVVWRQMNFVDNKDLGFNREQIVIVELHDPELRKKAGFIKEQLLLNPNIVKVSASSRAPSQVVSNQGRTWQLRDGEKDLQVYYCEIDSSFLNLYEIKLLAGKNLSATSHHNDVVVNESLVQELGYTNQEIVGTLFVHGDSTNVIGVVQDFHFQDFREKIQPLRLKNFVWGPPRYLSLKINEADMQGTLKFVEETFNAISDKYPFEYAFYDDVYYRSYLTEIKTAKIMGWFAGIAILIATMGLYGLVLFVLNQRIREIGIRKVLGASSISIIKLMSSHFVILVLIGYLVACSIGYYGMSQWLDQFAYKIPLNFEIFLLTLLALAAITGTTVFLRVRQATLVNPASILKQE